MPLTTEFLQKLSNTPLLSNNWYYIASAAFSVCNYPETIPQIYKYVLNQASSATQQEQFDISQKTREALLKSAALGGLPMAINSLTMLKNSTPIGLRDTKLHREQTIQSPNDLIRGSSFWDAVYGKVSKRVMGQLSTAYPDLGHWALNHVYSPLLSYTDILGPKETSFVVIACLVPLDVNPQLKGHLKGALNNGASIEEVNAVRQMAIDIGSFCGVKWRMEPSKLDPQGRTR